MARITGPLHSVKAHGTIAKRLNFSHRKEGQICRDAYTPKNPQSSAQCIHRHIVASVTAHWQGMSDEDKNIFILAAEESGQNLPGYQYFLSCALSNLQSVHKLAAYYPMNTISGNADTLLDASGCGFNLEQQKTAAYASAAASFAGKFNNALYFSQKWSLFEIESTILGDLIRGSFLTLEVWLNIEVGSDSFQSLIATNGDSPFIFWHNSDAYLGYTYYDSDWHEHWNEIPASKVPLGEWFQFNLVRDGTNEFVYINGEQVYTAVQYAYAPQDDYFDLGSEYVIGGQWLGGIDEMMLFSRGMTPTEVLKRYEASK